jgi:hypothetical protein
MLTHSRSFCFSLAGTDSTFLAVPLRVSVQFLWICGDIFLTQLYYGDGQWLDCIQKPKQRISFSCTISMYHAMELRKSTMKLSTVIWSHKLGVLIALNFDSQHNTMHIPYYKMSMMSARHTFPSSVKSAGGYPKAHTSTSFIKLMSMMSARHTFPSSVKSAGYFWVPKSSYIYQFY